MAQIREEKKAKQSKASSQSSLAVEAEYLGNPRHGFVGGLAGWVG